MGRPAQHPCLPQPAPSPQEAPGALSLVDGHCDVFHKADLQLGDIGLLPVHHLHRPVAHGLLLQAASGQAWPLLPLSGTRTKLTQPFPAPGQGPSPPPGHPGSLPTYQVSLGEELFVDQLLKGQHPCHPLCVGSVHLFPLLLIPKTANRGIPQPPPQAQFGRGMAPDGKEWLGYDPPSTSH